MKLDPEQCQRVAELARIEVDADGLVRLSSQLGKILEFFEQLDAVNTEGVEPTTSVVEVSGATREDVVRESALAERIVDAAPRRDASGHIVVPKIIGG
ncbi:MAG: Asp-tRNA(Asn)/Glu-tRNA(Gln) amidotransferase subunit GatC [Deltaproteobacteria bacterium]|nr:Asp-tRNA(Asn)/Glu-tRNA(Gln) amidotransferase subunit GatC [Deltaproteobacteria bacterium]